MMSHRSTCVVPQSLILSPILFNTYMKPPGGVIREPGVMCCQYNGDTQLFLWGLKEQPDLDNVAFP